MFRWLKRKGQLAILRTMNEDIDRFLVSLEGMDAEAIGMVVACATHWRNVFSKDGINLREPMMEGRRNPMLAFEINRMIAQAQKADPSMAAGLMVWLHTIRAVTYPELRLKGRRLWGQLRRGFEFAQGGANDLHQLSGRVLDATGHDQIPADLNPDFS